MTGINCVVPGVPHRHDTAAQARACWVASRPIVAPPRPPARPADPHHVMPRVIHTHEAPTDSQLNYITKLNGDVVRARQMTRLGASQYINQLKAAKENRPVSDVKALQVTAKRPVTVVPLLLLRDLKPGRYAWRAAELERWTFIRVSIPKSGRLAGFVKIQTQHGESLTDRMTVSPSDVVVLPIGNQFIEPVILGIIADPMKCAIDYAREMHRCCRCGKSLTDPRSRWYGIGPECEGMWSPIVQRVIEQIGEWDGTDRYAPNRAKSE